jgi:hypothetical protein
MSSTTEWSRLVADDDVVVLPATVPLRLGADGPIIGEATVLRTADGELAVTVDRLDGGTKLDAGLLRPLSGAHR